MKKVILFILTIFLSSAVFAQTYNTIDIDGVAPGSKANDWNSDEDFTDISSADNAYFTWDADYIYVGIKDEEADYGNLATFIYFDTDPGGDNGYIGGYAWNDDIVLPFKGDYVIVIKSGDVPANDYIEIRTLSSGGYTQVAQETSLTLDNAPYYVQAAVGTDYREFRIKRTTLGSPDAIKVCMFTEQQYGSNWRYFTWPSEDWTDVARASGQTIDHYKGYKLTTGLSPDNARAHDGILDKNYKVLDLRGVSNTFRVVDNVDNDLDVTDTYTFETWLYVAGYSAYDRVAYRADVFALYFLAGINDAADFRLRFSSYNSSGGTVASITTNDISIDSWHHIAISSDGTNTRIFVDGTQTASAGVITLRSETTSLSIGSRWLSGTYDKFLNGSLDEFRLSNSARYTSSFTITKDTAPFNSDANTVLLHHFDDDALPPTNSSDKTFTINNSPNAIVVGDYEDWNDASFAETLPLPVELTSFTASSTGSATVLNWETATEVNNYGFDVESSNDNTTWNVIGFVNGHGNSNTPQSYSFVATDGAKQYRLKQIDTDGSFEYSDVVEVEANLSYKLYQNHPNPFNPTTQINFSIPEASKVSITVFNALGQEVAELANREFAVGNHTVNFNASNLTSGIYFYRMNSANFSQTMKMLLLK